LYVLDGGTLESDPERYRLKKEDVATTQLSIVSFLIVHPKGTLMWDTGAIADDSWTPNGRAVQRRLVLSNSQERLVTLRNSLTAQLAAIGYSPAAITYLALSHYHWDHTANANLFARATWLARPVEREAMLPQRPPDVPQPSTFAELQNSKTIPITTDDHNVFGDGTVVLKLAKGHTPGHQVLYVKLAKTGGVVLSGDLYHYPEERTLNRLPVAEFNVDQTRASREAIEAFLKKTGAALWIQHDFTGMAKVKKSPAYYD
jgi:glyoxylase-like metal-dependent hydrolase (beta-lactamase superfamily II)